MRLRAVPVGGDITNNDTNPLIESVNVNNIKRPGRPKGSRNVRNIRKGTIIEENTNTQQNSK